VKTALLLIAGLAAAILSIDTANAKQPANSGLTSFQVASKAWPVRPIGPWHPTQRTGHYKTYEECRDAAVKDGWRSMENFWFCSSPQLQ
jgi:hypothetical protein